MTVSGTHELVVLKEGEFNVVFEGERVRGVGRLHGKAVEFVLSKVDTRSPTLGMKPPAGATVLFDGAEGSAWQHTDGRALTWKVKEGALETNSSHWNKKKNGEEGIGGMIATKEAFGSCRFHMEFRYPVEAGKMGQARGNSGLFFHPVGEIQILNSYMTHGYWNECGAIYKRVPAKVNAAGPPLQWQTYDVELVMPDEKGGMCELTVRLNGRIIHNKMELPVNRDKVTIQLQDHINRIQFRNIWLVEE